MKFRAPGLREKIFVAITAVALLLAWVVVPSGEEIDRDALENLTAAYNLSRYGIISFDKSGGALEPGLRREPLPIIVLAGYMSALSPWIDDQDLSALSVGANARLLKYSNLIWGLMLTAITVVTALYFTNSWTAACAATWIVQLNLGGGYDTLLSEIAAATLLALASFLLLRAIRTQRTGTYLCAGLCFGALCLTKAAFLYVVIVFVVVFFCAALLRRSLRRSMQICVLATGFAVVVLPWMVRNLVQLDSFSIADRGGQVLYLRAVKNLMTAEEYRGTFYAYAPAGVKEVIGVLLGYSRKDLAAGGRLQRLNRRVGSIETDETSAEKSNLSFYIQARIHHLLLLKKYAGQPDPSSLADAEEMSKAIAIIRQHPWRHAALTLAFLWRGAPYAAFIFATFAFVYIWRRRDEAMLWYILPSIGILAFYASLTHFLPRYGDPIVPIAAICFLLLFHRYRNENISAE